MGRVKPSRGGHKFVAQDPLSGPAVLPVRVVSSRGQRGSAGRLPRPVGLPPAIVPVHPPARGNNRSGEAPPRPYFSPVGADPSLRSGQALKVGATIPVLRCFQRGQGYADPVLFDVCGFFLGRTAEFQQIETPQICLLRPVFLDYHFRPQRGHHLPGLPSSEIRARFTTPRGFLLRGTDEQNPSHILQVWDVGSHAKSRVCRFAVFPRRYKLRL